MLLLELFKQPVEYTITQSDINNYIAMFEIDNQQYVVAVEKDTVWPNETPLPKRIDKVWEIGFSTAEAETEEEFTELTGKGHAARVFATVIAFVKSAVYDKGIHALKVSAKTHQPNRVRLYQRMANSIANQHGWSIADAGVQDGEHVWYVYEE